MTTDHNPGDFTSDNSQRPQEPPREPYAAAGQQGGYQWTPPPQQPYGPPGQQPGYQWTAPAQPGAYGSLPATRGASSLSAADETMWAGMAHWLGILIGFIGPLIALIVQGEKSPRVRAAAVESLNFQITLLIGWVAAVILSFVLIGFLLYPVLGVIQIVFPLLAALSENRGQPYRYPFALRLVR